jgi:hypothetical protein
MKRTRLSANVPDKVRSEVKRVRGEVKKLSFDQITDDLDDYDKAEFLKNQTTIEFELINIKRSVYSIGESLYKNKQILPHGMFIPWIKQAFDNELPYSTANLYMNIYKMCQNNPRTVDCIPMKHLLMMTNNEFPDEIVKLLNENPEKIDKIALQHINEDFNSFKNGEMSQDKFIELSKKEIKVGIEMWAGGGKHRLNANMRRPLELGIKGILKQIKRVEETIYSMAGFFPPDPNSPEYKTLLKAIDDMLKGLHQLKREFIQRGGIWKNISTEDGDKYIENI